MKKLLAIVLSLVLMAGMLTGCGAKSESVMDMAGSAGGYDDGGTRQESSLNSTADSSGVPQLENQKLVRKIWLNAETEEMDPLLNAVEQKITELSGYVEAREVYNGSAYSGRRYRHADITVRIPVDSLDAFVNHVTENANITSTNETVDNITLSYVATESRITALETEQTRLLELLAQAESMENLLKIEERLTEVRTELEEVTSQLRLYDNMVDYGTVYLTVTEVTEYTVVEEPETVWERIGTGLVAAFKNIGNFLTELFVFLVISLPYLLLIGVVITVVLLLVRAGKRRSKKQKEAKE